MSSDFNNHFLASQERVRIDHEWRSSPPIEEQRALTLDEMARAWGEEPIIRFKIKHLEPVILYMPPLTPSAPAPPPALPIGYVRYGVNGFETWNGTSWVPFTIELPEFDGEFFHEETNAPIQKTKPRRVLSSR